MSTMGKSTEMPERRGVWFYSYDQVRLKTRVEWIGSLVIGLFFLVLGVPFGISMWQMPTDSGWIGRAAAMVLPSAFVAVGLFEFPAALIYFYRKWHGIPVDIWDCETPNDPAVQEEHCHHPHKG